MTTKFQQITQNMFADIINHIHENGGLKISREEAFALFDMEVPRKVSRKPKQARQTMSKGERAFKKLVKKQQNSETRTLKLAFKIWNKAVDEQKKKAQREAEKERKQAEKQAEKERKAAERQAEKEQKQADKQAEKERKAAERQAEKERKAAERQAKKEQEAAEKKAKKEQEAAEKKITEEELMAIEEELRQAEEVLASIEVKRPRGRSPKGKKWDADAGEWVPKLELDE